MTTLLDRILLGMEAPSITDHHHRALQPPALPDYTSPPTAEALAATPEAFRSDEVVDAGRALAAAGNCTVDNNNRCHIPFPVAADQFYTESSVGVLLYGGALVDPRGYSPLALLLASRYGLPTVIPIFNDDVAVSFSSCDTGRLALAQAEFPNVEHWVLAGHSLGGVAAVLDTLSMLESEDMNAVKGLVLMGSNVAGIPGCGDVDFSNTNLPMATVLGTEDLILNTTREESSTELLSNATFFVDIYGGNHGQFGSYDDSQRLELLGQLDGVPLIPPHIQWDLTVSAIAHVASRSGGDLPKRIVQESSSTSSTTNATGGSGGTDEEIKVVDRCNPELYEEDGGSAPTSHAVGIGARHNVLSWACMSFIYLVRLWN